MEEEKQEMINAFLDAFNVSDVRSALKKRSLLEKQDRNAQGWKLWMDKESLPTPPIQWMKINGKIYYNDKIDPKTQAQYSPSTTKKRSTVDTSVKPAPADLKCPRCGSEMYKEGVCPGCDDGRKGYRIRLLCGNCDNTILL